MTRMQLGAASAALGTLVMAWTCVGRAQQPPGTAERVGERVGEAIDGAVKGVRRGASAAGEAVREKFARARTAVNNMGIEARIYGRIHWDRVLHDAAIDLEVRRDGVALLRGTVPDAAAKAKAVTLARETVGVSQVEDYLVVGVPATSRTTTTTETVTTPSGRTTVTTESTTREPRPRP